MMYFMNEFDDLIGKTISYIDLESDSECVIGTTDGGILTFDTYSEEIPDINKGRQAEYFLLNRQKLVDKLIDSGMPIEEDYKELRQEHELRKKREENERIKAKKATEYQKYLELKQKFEG